MNFYRFVVTNNTARISAMRSFYRSFPTREKPFGAALTLSHVYRLREGEDAEGEMIKRWGRCTVVGDGRRKGLRGLGDGGKREREGENGGSTA